MNLVLLMVLGVVMCRGKTVETTVLEKTGLEYVAEMLENANWEMSRRDLRQIQLPDLEWFPILADLELRKVRLENMASMALVGPIADQVFQLTQETDDEHIFHFDLKVGLRNISVSLLYQLTVMSVGEDHGKVTFSGHNNALRLCGTLITDKYRSCHTKLNSLTLGVFSGIREVTLRPSTILKRFLAFGAKLFIQHGLNLYKQFIDDTLEKYTLHNELVNSYLHEFMCYPFITSHSLSH